MVESDSGPMSLLVVVLRYLGNTPHLQEADDKTAVEHVITHQ